METSLHKQLKQLFAASPDLVEVAHEGFRIDAIDENGTLIEIQHAGLGILRNKISALLKGGNRVRIVKPWVVHKVVETYDKSTGLLLRRRKSPKQQKPIQFFGELIHFTSVFPHKNLSIEILLVHCIEKRVDTPKRGRRKQYKSLDIQLAHLPDDNASIVLERKKDLWRLLGDPKLPKTFDTQQLAEAISEPRWMAQQAAYVLKHCGAARVASKKGNAIIYRAA